jgi:UDP-2,3-diacylglucosamine hydrolase
LSPAEHRTAAAEHPLRIAVLADAHIGGPGGGAGPLVEQLEALPGQGCDRLLLMGDLFQVWVAETRFETPDISAVVAALRRLRSQGVRVDYIEGNRDFFIARSSYADAFDSVVLEISFQVGDTRYLALHGDGLNDRDWQYRFWRWLSKSAPAHLGLALTPRRLAQKLVGSTEHHLAQTNFRHRAELPREAISHFAERRLAEGHDVLLLGHFHDDIRWEVPHGEVRLLPAWFRTKRLGWIDVHGVSVGPDRRAPQAL